jgi:hypothetical protein
MKVLLVPFAWLIVLTAVILLTSCATCDLAKDHTPGLSCPPADGSHGPCPFECKPIVKR